MMAMESAISILPSIDYWCFSQQTFVPSANCYCRTQTYHKCDFRHTDHLLRERTSRPLTGEMELFSTQSWESAEGVKNAICMMHAPERTKFKRSKMVYLEFLCYPGSQDALLEYMKELEQRFNTLVYSVVHLDESMLHAHVVVEWRNNEGRCLRLQRRGLYTLWKETVTKVNGRSVDRRLARKPVKALLYALRRRDNERYLQIHDYVRRFCDVYNRFCLLLLDAERWKFNCAEIIRKLKWKKFGINAQEAASRFSDGG